MTVTDETNRDMNGFSEQKIYRNLHTRRTKTPRDPPAATRERLGFCPRRVPVPPLSNAERSSSQKYSIPHSHYGTTAINIRTRTVLHYDTDEKDRMLTIGKYDDGY